MVELKRWTHLVALAEERHFARAAERVHLSQPAFSRSIQLLESQVGMQLFARDSGTVRPTPAGLFLVDRARRLLFDARNLERDTEFYRDSRLGDAAFGAGPLPAATLMPQVLVELRKEYPGVNLRLEIGNWSLLCDRLLDEDLEFLVNDARDLKPDPRLEMTPLGRQQAKVFARAGHPLAGKPCTLAQAWRYGIASPKWPQPLQDLVARLIGLPAGASPVPAIECDDFSLLRQLALATDTLIGASEATYRADIDSGVLVRLDVHDLPEVPSEMSIVQLANRTPSPMAERAIGCVQKIAREVNA